MTAMKLPNAEHAIIQKEKLIHYLLSLIDEDGRPKAEYFRSIGFHESNVKDFERALLSVAKDNDVKKTVESRFGVKYVIEGLIVSPVGKKVMIRTIWSIDKGESNPRLVTAFHK